MTSKPKSRSPYKFKRTQVLVRVHPDDKPAVLATAAMLNKQRKGKPS